MVYSQIDQSLWILRPSHSETKSDIVSRRQWLRVVQRHNKLPAFESGRQRVREGEIESLDWSWDSVSAVEPLYLRGAVLCGRK